jgi:monoamine oxidase
MLWLWRHVMGCVLAVGLAAPVWSAPPSSRERERILVVGAGVSGLTAARLLHDSGFEVVVLEAKDRIGGRAWTRELGGVPVDLGAMFVHGTEGHPGAAVLESKGVAIHPRPQDLGLAYDATLDRELSVVERFEILTVAPKFLREGETLERTLAADASTAEAIELFLDREGTSGDRRRRESFGLEQLLLELFDSGPPRDTAFAHREVYQELDGGDHLPAGGYVSLVEILAAGLDVRLKTRVQRVEYGRRGVRLRTSSGDFEGDRVLVTVSQGVLESGAIAFDPPLPRRRKRSIERLDMGNLEKVVFVFEQPFWRGNVTESRSFLYLGENLGELPACFDFSEAVGKPSLTCLYGGQSARDLLRSKSSIEIEARAVEILREMFGAGVPHPVAITSTRWLDDTEFLGSYSYLPVGSGPEDMIELGQPVRGRVFFAGEATVPEYYGTIHGAMLSGIREAKRLGATRTDLEALCSHLAGCK